MRKRNIAIILLVIGLVLLLASFAAYRYFLSPTNSNIPATSLNDSQRQEIEVLRQDLDTPWSIVALPDERLMVTERSGIVRILDSNNQQFEIADVVEQGEGGLLGIAIDPNFEQNNFVYVYKTISNSNIVERYTLTDNQLANLTTTIDSIPSAANHNGGLIAFGPDDKLYITTGDAQQDNLAQDTNSLAGKILRINSDGSIPSDNPFGNAIWSFGHRNPQGLAWDDQDRLWSTEHGPSGTQTGNDELNLIVKGGNYGWPIVRGQETRDGMIAPVAESGITDTWAPGGLAFSNGSLYFAGLRAQTLYEAKINNDSSVELTRHLSGLYGRLRAVTSVGDTLIISTSNRDGRGVPKPNDDKLLIVPVSLL